MESEEIKSAFNTALTINERLAFGWGYVMQSSIKRKLPEWNSALCAIGRELRHLMTKEQREKFDTFSEVTEIFLIDFYNKMSFDYNRDCYFLKRNEADYEDYSLFCKVLNEFDTFLREIQEHLDLGLSKKENAGTAIIN